MAAIVESQLILGTTVIKTGLQVRLHCCCLWLSVHRWPNTQARCFSDALPSLTTLPSQIAGTVVTVVAVTFYMFWTWRASRAQQAATAAVTPAADGQSALAGDGQPAPVEVRVTVERCTA